MSLVRPTKSETPRSCSVRPKSVPTLPRSRTRASMKPLHVLAGVVPERGAHDAVLERDVGEQRVRLIGRGPCPLDDAVDLDVVAIVASASASTQTGSAWAAAAAPGGGVGS